MLERIATFTALLCAFICIVVSGILIVRQQTLYGNDTVNDWLVEVDDLCANSNLDVKEFTNICETKPSLPLITVSQEFVDFNKGLLYLVLLTAMLTLLTIFGISIGDKKKTTKLLRTEYQKGYRNGHRSGIEKVIEVIDMDISVLRNIIIWLDAYDTKKSNTHAAASIFEQLMDRLESGIQLEQLGVLGEYVEFSLEEHRTQEVIRPGARVQIIEPGWQLAHKIIRKPLVSGVA